MKFHYLKSLSAVALAGMFAMNANAETISEEYVIDFTKMEAGHLLNSFWGGPNPGMSVVETEDGNLFYMSGDDGETEDGLKKWDTLARITPFSLPGGYNLSDVAMITVEYMPTQDAGLPFGIQLQNPQSGYIVFDELPVVNEWNTAVFTLEDLKNPDGEAMTVPGSADFCFGIKGSTYYYVKSITFYLEKEVTQREKDEAALDKETAACVEFNFDNWEVSEILEGNNAVSPYIGSNGGGVNRADMIIDKGPAGYDNNCAHIIYGGHTNIFITQPVEIPEGYTFDDLRLVEYDLYLTNEKGVDGATGEEFSGTHLTPALKLKDNYAWGWEPVGGEGTAAVSGVPEVGKWNKVEFRPSAFVWASREIDVPVVDENGDPVLDENNQPTMKKETQEGEAVAKEFGKKTKFWMSIGFRPCLNQCYVDNVKCWFQKSTEGGDDQSGVESVAVESDSVNVYNLQGICILKNADKAALNTLPAGLYIVNGKKYLVK